MRIVSLLPAATDILVGLGLEAELVGRTHECVAPSELLSRVPVVTATNLVTAGRTSREIHEAVAGRTFHDGSSLYALDLALLDELDPDLVITQELCDSCAISYDAVSQSVRAHGNRPRILSLDARGLEEVLDSVTAVGLAAGCSEKHCASVQRGFSARLDRVEGAVVGRSRPRTAIIEWLDPPWPAGHWVPDQVHLAGGTAVLATTQSHTHAISWAEVAAADPEILVFAPCGLPLDQTLRELPEVLARPELQTTHALRDDAIWAMSGPLLFNCPGPRLVRGVEVLAAALHGVERSESTEAVRVHRTGRH